MANNTLLGEGKCEKESEKGREEVIYKIHMGGCHDNVFHIGI